MFKEIVKGYQIGSNIKGLLLMALVVGFATSYIYTISKAENLSLFISATIGFLAVTVYCGNRTWNYKMSLTDFLGNVLITGIIVYLGIFVLIKTVPEISIDAYITEFIAQNVLVSK